MPARPDKASGGHRPGGSAAATVGLVKGLGSERYVSITSFRRDGTAVATPVWVVSYEGRLYVWTGAQAWPAGGQGVPRADTGRYLTEGNPVSSRLRLTGA